MEGNHIPTEGGAPESQPIKPEEADLIERQRAAAERALASQDIVEPIPKTQMAERKIPTPKEKAEMARRVQLEIQATAFVKSEQYKSALKTAFIQAEQMYGGKTPEWRGEDKIDDIRHEVHDFLISKGKLLPSGLLKQFCVAINLSRAENVMNFILTIMKDAFADFQREQGYLENITPPKP